MAATLMTHAYHRVSLGHKNKLGRFMSHKAGEAWRTSTKGDVAATSIGLGVGAGIFITASVLTGGLLPGVIAGIAGGSYLVKKAVKTISFDYGRLNRNWLHNYQRASSMDAQNYADGLGIEARDAIRRAIDHYNITRDVIQKELKPIYDKDFHTCNDAINRAKATARFIHHSDKTRNYLLPCIDLSILLLLQYKELSDKWNRVQAQFDANLEAWFEYHDSTLIGHCNRDNKELCYGSTSSGSITPRRPHSSSSGAPSGGGSGRIGAVNLEGNSIDILDMVNALAEGSVKSIQNAMTRNGIKPAATRNFHSVMPEMSPHEALAAGRGNEKRFKQLIDDAYAAADRPGYLGQIRRRMGHSISRRTKGEIALDLFSEVVDLGSVATPFIPNLPVGEILKTTVNGGSLIRGGITGTTSLGSILGGVASFKSNEQAAIKSGLIDWGLVESTTSDTVIAAGVKIENLITKAGTHFHEAIEACRAIESVAGKQIGTCREAWEFGKAMAEVVHHMRKMEKYLMTSLSLIAFLGDETVKWSSYEATLWREMEDAVADWMSEPGVHRTCREAGSHCYGPHVTQVVRGGSLNNLLHGRFDNIVSHERPHKPL
jgi:hypothetical protein